MNLLDNLVNNSVSSSGSAPSQLSTVSLRLDSSFVSELDYIASFLGVSRQVVLNALVLDGVSDLIGRIESSLSDEDCHYFHSGLSGVTASSDQLLGLSLPTD